MSEETRSTYQTNCAFFSWKLANYMPHIEIRSFMTGGNQQYIPECREPQAVNMMLRPILYPCDGCPFFQEGEEQGVLPPNE